MIRKGRSGPWFFPAEAQRRFTLPICLARFVITLLVMVNRIPAAVKLAEGPREKLNRLVRQPGWLPRIKANMRLLRDRVQRTEQGRNSLSFRIGTG
jgi:hypothetical protein